MPTNFDAEEPTLPATPEAAPELPAEAPLEAAAEGIPEPLAELPTAPENEAPSGDGGAPDELGQLAEASAKARLAPADEERLTVLLKEAILGGRAGVTRAVELLPVVPWIVAVRAVEQTWPELTAGFRTQLLAGLAKDESDAARRVRLSLARALFKIEIPIALKVALGALKDLRDKETGGLSQKNAQIVSNVFIGRGKPWLAQFPLAELKPAEVDLLVHSAVLAAFSLSHPPVTQLGVLKWAQEAGRLEAIQEPALSAATGVVARWSNKWQNALRKEVSGLPEMFLAVMKPEAPAAAPAPEGGAAEPTDAADDEDDRDRDDEDEDDAPRKERPVYEPRPQRQPEATENREPREPKERPVYTPRNAGSAEAREAREPRETREPREPREPRGGGGRGFNVNDALKGIEAHLRSLQTDLAQAQAKLRQKEERPKRPEKFAGPIIEGEPTPEELARLNLQLESRNTELQARIDELAEHSEDLAASSGAMTSEPVNDTAAQLRSLLGFKLKEDFEDFLALEQEGNDIVVQQHYRTIMRHVFEVLREVQIPLVPGPDQTA